ncbi:MAG: tail fiber domain-containing protein [Bacteroidetes bacterium]|nr:tail fiber domain-containing protein [Bacteroidota bacterium]
MKKKIYILAAVVIIQLLVPIVQIKAQNGMDFFTIIPTQNADRLRAGTGLFSNLFNSKGLGVYQLNIMPASALEVNTDFTHFPATQTTPYLKGEVFRTDCPLLQTSFWRMFRGGLEHGRLYNPAVGQINDFVIENAQIGGNLLFSTQGFPGPLPGMSGAVRMCIIDGVIASGTTGAVGIGANFLSPQSLLHINDGNFATYLQITNNFTGAGTPNDGARFGTNPVNVGTTFLNVPFAEVRQEENAPLRFLTNGAERMRIMGNTNQNIVTPAIAANNVNPGFVGIGCTNPMSRLHIGGNSLFFPNGNPADGYRPWMVEGLFTYQNSDNMYFGHHDVTGNAIINWGNDPVSSAVGGGDRLLFVFTAAVNINPPQPFACGPNGLEAARMVSNGNIVLTGFGGDPVNNVYSVPLSLPTSDPGNTVEINSPLPTNVPVVPANNTTGSVAPSPVAGYTPATGWSGLRFTDLTSNSIPVPTGTTGTTVNMLSVNSDGDVILVPGGGTFGQVCNAAGNPGSLTNYTEVPTSGFNFVFTNNQTQASSRNNVGIGLTPGNCSPQARLDVLNTTANQGTKGIQVVNTDAANATSSSIGIYSRVSGNPSLSCRNIPGWFESTVALGAGQMAIVVPRNGGSVSIGFANPFPNTCANINANALLEVGGNAYKTGGGNVWSVPSDSILKTDIHSFSDGLAVLRQIHPVTYKYNGIGGLPTNNEEIGVIAEQIVSFAPYTIDTSIIVLDTMGTQQEILTFNSGPLTFASINAIKQLDSALTKSTSLPDAPILISPANAAVGDFGRGAAAFTYHSVSAGVILYHAQIAKDNSFSNIVLDQSGITDTTFSAGFCDTIPATYYWRVSAKNNAGAGAWSQIFSFTDTAKCIGIGPKPVDTIRQKTAVSFNSSSDIRFKTNVAPVTSALDKVSALNAVYYNWIPTPGYEFDSARQIGFIAQDVQQVVPQVVHTDANGFLTLDYGRVVPVLVEAIKTLKAEVDSLKNTTARTTGNNSATSQIDVNLASKKIVLDQNNPNPFKEQTTIPYFIPKDANDVMIIFTDMDGDIIKEVKINEKGKGQLNVYASDLSSGIYTYSIVADGITLDTKKMIKTK